MLWVEAKLSGSNRRCGAKPSLMKLSPIDDDPQTEIAKKPQKLVSVRAVKAQLLLESDDGTAACFVSAVTIARSLTDSRIKPERRRATMKQTVRELSHYRWRDVGVGSLTLCASDIGDARKNGVGLMVCLRKFSGSSNDISPWSVAFLQARLLHDVDDSHYAQL